MSRKLSLYALLATIVLIGVLFYQVIQPFVFSLLLATVIAVMFRPIHIRVIKWCRGRERLAAGLTTAAVMLLILLPVSAGLVAAGFQLFDVSTEIVRLINSAEGEQPLYAKKWEEVKASHFVQPIVARYDELSIVQQEQLKALMSQAARGAATQIYDKTVNLVADLVHLVVGMVIMALALYYFLADGSMILREFQDLSPLEDKEEAAFIDQFGRVCRGVITGTIVAAMVQATLAGIGFYFAGVPYVLLWMSVTLFFAFIPFLGAGSVVAAVTVWLLIQGHYLAGGLLLAYGLLVVATADNFIKAYIIGNEAQMNPLVVLMTVFGALQLIGLWGILAGPLIAAFFYTALKLLRERIVRDDPNVHPAANMS